MSARRQRRSSDTQSAALQPYAWMLISSFAFSCMGLCAAQAGRGCPWQVVALVRSLVPLVLLTVWARRDGVRLAIWGPPVLWMRSIAGSISLVGTFYGLTHLRPSEVYTLQNAFPIWVALLSWPLLGEVPSPAIWLSIASGLVGVVLVQRPDVDGLNLPALIVVGVSVCTALAMMGLHRLKHIDPRAVVVHFSGVSTLFTAAALLLLPTDVPAGPLDVRQVLLLTGVGIGATVGQLFLTRAFAAGAPARVSVVSLTQVVFVLALEAILLGNIPDPAMLLGTLLILVPTAWIMLRPRRATRVATPRAGASREPAPTLSEPRV